MELQRGMRGKLADHIDITKPFEVIMLADGDSVYDFCCFGLNKKEKLSDERYLLFYNQKASPAGELRYTERKGGISFQVNLPALPKKICRLVFTVSIDGKGSMDQVRSHVCYVSQNGISQMEFNLTGKDFQNQNGVVTTAINAAVTIELYKKGTEWRFAAVASGFNGGLQKLIDFYGINENEQPADDEKPADVQPADAKQPEPAPVPETVPAPEAAPEPVPEAVPAEEEPVPEKKKKSVVSVHYNAYALTAKITVNGHAFDTSRIKGKEIEDWLYPFVLRKVRWDGFYNEMVTALGGEKAFDLIFEGSDDALTKLRKACGDAPVNIVSGEQDNIAEIIYNADALTTEITVNGQPFDTSRINGREIEDWVFPFMMRNVKWNGIFSELRIIIDSDEYGIRFSGSEKALNVLMKNAPDTVTVTMKDEDADEQAAAQTALTDAELGKRYYYLMKAEKYDEVLALLKPLDEQNNAYAQYYLGEFYIKNDTAFYDPELSFLYQKKSAEGGCCLGQLAYAKCLDFRKKEPEEAIKWYKAAAEHPKSAEEAVSASAKWYLGMKLCRCGSNAADKDEALRLWLESYDEKPDEITAFSIAECYRDHVQDYAKALEWYEKSDRNDVPVQLGMGMIYRTGGHGAEQNLTKAAECFRPAAEAENAAAMFGLGACLHAEGNAPEQAAEWLEKAAAAGNSDAAELLAQIRNPQPEPVPETEASPEEPAFSLSANDEPDTPSEFAGETVSEPDAPSESAGETVSEPDAPSESVEETVSEPDAPSESAGESVSEPDAPSESAEETVSEPDTPSESAEETVSELIDGIRSRLHDNDTDGLEAQIARLTAFAEQGDADAQNLLGYCLSRGKGVPQDIAAAVTWLTKSADQGNYYAMTALALRYVEGDGIEKNEAEAYRLFRAAADAGYAPALGYTASCLLDGVGTAQNPQEGAQWAKKGAEQGDANAMELYGQCCENGNGVDENPAEAFRWYQKSAESGSVIGQDALADCYLNGVGTSVNDHEAFLWYQKAANAEYPPSMCSLGDCYKYSLGVSRDMKEAMNWYLKSAKQGYGLGAFNAGKTCLEEGSPRNVYEAVKYFQQGIKSGYETNRIYELLGKAFYQICCDKAKRAGKDAAYAAELPEMQKGIRSAEYAITKFDCDNAEDGSVYMVLADMYAYIDKSQALAYANLAVELGVENAAETVKKIKSIR